MIKGSGKPVTGLLKVEVDESVQLRIIHRGVGAITESDVNLATIDNADDPEVAPEW